MAERRMFAKTIIDSDAFLDMPLSAQALYFHLSMRADDDGFINNPKKIQRMVGASDDDCKLLIVKRFIITFESGVIVIKHWKLHNYIQKDRYKPTIYQEEKRQLVEKENKAYTECIQSGYIADTQDRLEIELGKNSIEKEKEKKKARKPNSYDEILSQIADDSLRELYLEYIKMRKFIKSPMTDRALTMLINKVNELEPHSIDRQKKLLETAIVNNWKSVYPLKAKPKEKYGSYDADDFFNAALKRSALEREAIKRAEEKTPPKTAADDEGIRIRMEALQNKLKE